MSDCFTASIRCVYVEIIDRALVLVIDADFVSKGLGGAKDINHDPCCQLESNNQ